LSRFLLLALVLLSACRPKPGEQPVPDEAAVDAAAVQSMKRENVHGLALAVIDAGTVRYVAAYGVRNEERKLPLTTETVMAGASLTQAAFAYMVQQLADESRLNLDAAGKDFDNLQRVLEESLHLDVGKEMQARVFDRFGMARTSMQWRPDFADNVADGYGPDGAMRPHDQQRHARAADSMDTTIYDQARLWAGVIKEDWVPRFGVVTFESTGGPAWFKGGHDHWTGNMVLCQRRQKRCLVVLANDARAERIFPELAQTILGDTGMPWNSGPFELPPPTGKSALDPVRASVVTRERQVCVSGCDCQDVPPPHGDRMRSSLAVFLLNGGSHDRRSQHVRL
jgi:CubicO group peptidase (beta-lactamase class C family)